MTEDTWTAVWTFGLLVLLGSALYLAYVQIHRRRYERHERKARGDTPDQAPD